ncbi:YybH family protein [Rhodococcoides kyotonense]|uniref:Ketosteroid isomerase homolog n=1 Tax=Rhodococcoides kyotonense TaxID=398843 RepID=A0A239MEH1_9NOCA|nr:nuclear transport factor 2 family protein [Rhodococcus kyotonensis]SNT41076.1 Ketosteroid isomerase homolog [Rhodococcus kyotonensis]
MTRELLEVYSEAAYAKDVDRFMTMYSEDVRVFDLWNTWEFVGAAAWRESIAGWFGSLGDERVVVEFDDVVVSGGADFGSISAVVSYSGESASGERVRHMQNRLTWVLVRRADGWRVIHEHTSAPVEDSSGKVILTRG